MRVNRIFGTATMLAHRVQTVIDVDDAASDWVLRSP
jgi:hypothetical protein